MVLPVGVHFAPHGRLVKLFGHNIVSPGLPYLFHRDVWPMFQLLSALDGEQRRIYSPLEIMVWVVAIWRPAPKSATAVVFVSERIEINFVSVPEDFVNTVHKTSRDY